MLRRRLIVEKAITEAQASAALARLRDWHLHHASIAPLVDAAWIYRHNMTAADALYVVLAEHLGADFLTDDHNLVDGPTFPAGSMCSGYLQGHELGPCRTAVDRTSG